MVRLRFGLAALALASAELLAPGARAQTAQIAATDLGNVVSAATGVTIFRMAPSDGTVSVLSGGGARISAGAVRFVVTIPCTNPQCDIGNNTLVTVSSVGTPAGRAGALSNFTLAIGTATLVSGPTGANPMIFTIGGIGRNASVTIYIGADLPIFGDDSGKTTGTASTSISVQTTTPAGTNVATTQGSATATATRSLSIAQDTPLNFGRIVLPASGGGIVSLPASTGVLSVTGATAFSPPAPALAAFTVSGEGGQAISISVPSTFTLSQIGGGSLTVTTSNTAQSPFLSNTLGAAGSYSFNVGGDFSVSSTTPVGSYSGTYLVTVAYN